MKEKHRQNTKYSLFYSLSFVLHTINANYVCCCCTLQFSLARHSLWIKKHFSLFFRLLSFFLSFDVYNDFIQFIAYFVLSHSHVFAALCLSLYLSFAFMWCFYTSLRFIHQHFSFTRTYLCFICNEHFQFHLKRWRNIAVSSVFLFLLNTFFEFIFSVHYNFYFSFLIFSVKKQKKKNCFVSHRIFLSF